MSEAEPELNTLIPPLWWSVGVRSEAVAYAAFALAPFSKVGPVEFNLAFQSSGFKLNEME